MRSLQRYLVALTATLASFLFCVWMSSTKYRWTSHEERTNDDLVQYHKAIANIHRYSAWEKSLASDRKYAHDNKTVLLVGKFYLYLTNPQSPFESCPINSCRLVHEADGSVDPKNADVIMFASEIDKKKLAAKFLPKPLKQIWIASHMESSARNWLKTRDLGAYINWSATYRPDSHIMTPYGRFYRKKSVKTLASSRPTVINWAANKTKKVAWFVSNCWDLNGRKNYGRELAKHITVDIYGQCGKMTCLKNNTEGCFELLKRDYKFYLAFENSNCRYYMTEKLFVNAYSNNVIPVVMGAHRADYALALPPHSYIHVDDFDSPRDLAKYLRRLDSDDKLYNEYFRWKTKWSINYVRYDMCLICGLLHAADFQNYVHWYPEYTRYWDADACSSKWKKKNGIRWQRW